MKFNKHITILTLALCLSSCAIHDYFPFFCFERGCVNQQWNLKGFKKRMKANVFVVKRKLRRKKNDSKTGTPLLSYIKTDKNNEKDSGVVTKGMNVDYYRYWLYFRAKSTAAHLDSVLVEHTTEYRTLIETDQARLNRMIDTLGQNNILVVYIKPSHHNKTERDYYHHEKHRCSDIKKFIRSTGLKSGKFIVISDTLFPGDK